MPVHCTTNKLKESTDHNNLLNTHNIQQDKTLFLNNVPQYR
jgi:hypothetical protein